MTGPEEWLAAQLQRLSTALRGGSRPQQRVAVLIDGDSFGPRLADPLFAYGNALGHVVNAQLFANFAAVNAGAWSGAIRMHGIIGTQHFHRATGRNGADIALTIAAMDLLTSHCVDRFVIVTSDSDFTALAHRLRRAGAAVHGVGPKTASSAFKTSCTVFVEQDLLLDRALSWGAEPEQPPALWSREPADAEAIIVGAMVRMGAAHTWIELPALRKTLEDLEPTFDTRVYRRRNLEDLLGALSSVELDTNTTPSLARIALRRNG